MIFPRGPKLSAVFPLPFTPQIQMPPPLITPSPQRESLKTRRSGSPVVCPNSCMQLFSHECCGLSMPFWKTHPDQMLAGVARSGGVVHFKVSACCLWSPYWSRAAWCSLLFGDKATDSTPSLSRQTYKHKHPISNPLVGLLKTDRPLFIPFQAVLRVRRSDKPCRDISFLVWRQSDVD